MIPMPLSVADLATDVDELLTCSIESGDPSNQVTAIRKAGKQLLRAGGHSALVAAGQLIAVRNCSCSTRNQRIDLLQDAWSGLAKRQAKAVSLNAWRQRKRKGTLLIGLAVSKSDRQTLVELGRLQVHEFDNAAEIASAISGLLEELTPQ